jgi:hypothetical protein
MALRIVAELKHSVVENLTDMCEQTVMLCLVGRLTNKPCGMNYKLYINCIRFEAFTALTMKNAIFWDVVPC